MLVYTVVKQIILALNEDVQAKCVEKLTDIERQSTNISKQLNFPYSRFVSHLQYIPGSLHTHTHIISSRLLFTFHPIRNPFQHTSVLSVYKHLCVQISHDHVHHLMDVFCGAGLPRFLPGLLECERLKATLRKHPDYVLPSFSGLACVIAENACVELPLSV